MATAKTKAAPKAPTPAQLAAEAFHAQAGATVARAQVRRLTAELDALDAHAAGVRLAREALAGARRLANQGMERDRELAEQERAADDKRAALVDQLRAARAAGGE